MDRIEQFRQYAREAMQWAESAATEAERKALEAVVYAFAMAAFLEWRDTCFRQPNEIESVDKAETIDPITPHNIIG